MTSLAEPNALVFRSSPPKDHVESFFLKANSPDGLRAIWVRATVFSRASDPGGAIAEGWAIAFDRRGDAPHHVAVKHTLPFASATFDPHDLGARWRTDAGHMDLGPRHARGAITSGPHRLAFDLRFEALSTPLVPYPYEAMYRAGFPKSKTVSPSPDALFEGTVDVDRERWTIEAWRGMQGHNWGRGNADLYGWCHVNLWDSGTSEPLVLEGFSGQVQVGPVLTPLMTVVCVRYRGVDFFFNRPIDIARAKGAITKETDPAGYRWTFEAASDLGRVSGEVRAAATDMVGLYYANPSGPITHCLNSKLATATVRFEPTGRAPLDLTSRGAALEIGTHDRDHGVRMAV